MKNYPCEGNELLYCLTSMVEKIVQHVKLLEVYFRRLIKLFCPKQTFVLANSYIITTANNESLKKAKP